MRLHRFYVASTDLAQRLEISDKPLLWQWLKVLRLKVSQELILFNDSRLEAQYKIVELTKNSARLAKQAEIKPALPDRQVWLFWSLLKRDNNELILQKCTELGVTNFAPIISDRTIKKDFNLERAEKIAVEASEQCGRVDIPQILQSDKLENILKNYSEKIDLYVADQSGLIPNSKLQIPKTAGFIVGPEGGWTEAEQKLFAEYKLKKINIAQFTLRAETAAIVAAAKLL